MSLFVVAGLVASFALPPQPLPLADTRFRYSVTALSHQSRTLRIQPVQPGRPAQQLYLTGPAATAPADEVRLQDVNFDGQPDLVLTTAHGNANSQYDYWLYQPTTQQFVRNAEFSQLLGGSEIAYQPAKQQIVTANRSSCCARQVRTYAYQQGHLELVSTVNENLATGGK